MSTLRILQGNTALMGVSFKGHKAIAEMLINKGADVEQSNKSGQKALDFASQAGNSDIEKMLAGQLSN